MFTKLNINVGLCFGAFVVALFCVVAASRKNLNRLQHRTFLYISISCAAAPLFSLIADVLMTFCTAENNIAWLLMLLKVLFFLFHSFLAPTYALYVLSLNGTIIGRKKHIWFLYWIPAMFVEFFNVINAFLPSDIRPLYTYTVNADGMYVYERGPAAFVFYVVALGYAAYGVFAFIRNIKAMTTKKIFSMSFFIGFIFVGIAIQLINKDVKVEAFVESISVLSFLVILESDKESINRDTELYNEIAFYEDNATAMAAKRHYTIITVKAPDYLQYLEMLGKASYTAIEIEIAKYLTSVYKPQLTYYLASGSFGIMVYDDDEELVDQIVEKLEARFKEPWGNGKVEISPNWVITVAKVPEDIEGPSQLHYLFLGRNAKADQKVTLRKSASLQFIKRRSMIEGAIARGLRDNNFKLYYQPIWDAKRNRIVSAEALLRLIDPELGFIGPDEFIPVAEENGTIIDLGHWVFEEACRFARNNDVQNLGIEWLEINLSIYQLPEKDLAGRFLEIAHRYNIPPSFLNIEITESADADNDTELLGRIQNLLKVGFPLSLDDYGTGYSNLTRLIQSKYKNIKLDRSLLLSAEEGQLGKSVLSSIYKTMSSLSFHTIQEGVETEEQKNLILSFGANMIQGFLFSKPIPEKDFIEYVMKFNNIQYIA